MDRYPNVHHRKSFSLDQKKPTKTFWPICGNSIKLLSLFQSTEKLFKHSTHLSMPIDMLTGVTGIQTGKRDMIYIWNEDAPINNNHSAIHMIHIAHFWFCTFLMKPKNTRKTPKEIYTHK